MSGGVRSGEERSSGDRRLNAAIRALLVATVVLNLVYLGALLLPGDPASTLVNIFMSITVQWVPVGVFVLVAVRTRFARPEVILAGGAVAFNAAGDTFYALAMDSSGELLSPSPADASYLLYYPLMMAALLVLIRRQSGSSVRSVLFDGAVASLGAAAVLVVILGPVFTDASAGVTPLEVTVAALYPLFDVLLITAVIGVFASPVLRIGPRWQFLVLGFLLFAGGDIAYALLTHEGAYGAGSPLDAAWTGGVALVTIWVAGVTLDTPEPRPAASGARMLPVPAFAVLAGLGVLLFATQNSVPVAALVLAAATVALAAFTVLSRQAALTRLVEAQEHLVRELQRLDQAKSDMIGNMSHEMGTPLTSVLGYLDLLMGENPDLPQDAKAKLSVIERNARRLQDLARNMLLLARLESDGASTTSGSIEVRELLDRVEASLRPLADSRHVDLGTGGEVTAIVDGDEGQLEHALMNVMENAVKFTSAPGTVRAEVATLTGSNGRPVVKIDITDTGMGIPEDELPYLFDRFFRATNAKNEAVQGTGLGLSIVREIVRAHRGEIAVASVLGQGTVVSVTLPSSRAE